MRKKILMKKVFNLVSDNNHKNKIIINIKSDILPFTHAQRAPCGANLIIHVESGLLEDTNAGRVLLLHLVHHK